jgi:hypothetical protein
MRKKPNIKAILVPLFCIAIRYFGVKKNWVEKRETDSSQNRRDSQKEGTD